MQSYGLTGAADGDALTCAIIGLASKYGHCGYRRVTALLHTSGRQAGEDQVQRI